MRWAKQRRVRGTLVDLFCFSDSADQGFKIGTYLYYVHWPAANVPKFIYLAGSITKPGYS
jgi:hypothetical protein